MGQDAAIADHQRVAVAGEAELVRSDAAGRQLAASPEAHGRVIDADDAALLGEIVFGGIEQPSVLAERAMPKEMPVGRGLERGDERAAGEINGTRERAGRARE